MNPILVVQDLSVRIDGSLILEQVGFAVPAEGITLLLGRNGVGKTMTLKAILGLTPPSALVSGDVVLASARLTGVPTHERVRHGLGYVPEDRGVFVGLTVHENLRIAERDDQAANYDLVYALFPELARRRRQRAGSLSAVHRRMLLLARALLNQNQLLLIDEPTKGLEPDVALATADLLDRVSASVPILLVEQNLAVVRRIGRRAIVLADGRVAYAGHIQQLLLETELAWSLLGAGQSQDPSNWLAWAERP